MRRICELQLSYDVDVGGNCSKAQLPLQRLCMHVPWQLLPAACLQQQQNGSISGVS